MPRATSVQTAARRQGGNVIDTLILSHAQRQAKQGFLFGVKGTCVEFDFPEPVRLRTDDAVVLDDGSLVEIVAEDRGPGIADLNAALTTLGVLPPAQLPRFGIGGRVTPAPGIKVTAVHAEHSSVYVWNNPETKKAETHPAGAAVGFIIELENGFKIWHMGDTGLFADMKFIADYYKPDLVLIPVGGHFTMDPVDAAYALREFIKPKFAIPMHYNTNPFNRGTPEEMIKALGNTSIKVFAAKPGEKLEF